MATVLPSRKPGFWALVEGKPAPAKKAKPKKAEPPPKPAKKKGKK